jgi:adenosylhomocysteine nucleosidase
MDMSELAKGRIAMVAALEREVRPLIKGWPVSEKGRDGRKFRFFEHDGTVVVAGGIGSAAARRAAEAVIAIYAPEMIYSVGFAGALEPALKAGDVVQPQRVVNAGDGSSLDLDTGSGVLISFASVASREQKAKLQGAFCAQAVDMEAASVGRAAEARGVRFGVIKAISDEADFTFPAMEKFIDDRGQFLGWKFALHTGLRPWSWPQVVRLARQSRLASQALCDRLREIIGSQSSASVDTATAVSRQ